MELNQQSKALLDFLENGYYVSKCGDLYNRDDHKLKCRNSRGYLCKSHRIGKRSENKQIPIFIHRVQAYQKFGDIIFKDGVHVRHFNGESFDNSWDNIKIGTPRQNSMDRDSEERKMASLPAAAKNRKFSNKEIAEIKSFYEECRSYKEVKNKFGISSSGSLHYMLNSKYVCDKE